MARPIILIRGAGDLASGVAVRLHRAGYPVVMTEVPVPLAVRRSVSFSEAIFNGSSSVEGIEAERAETPADILLSLGEGRIPVLVDPELRKLTAPTSPLVFPIVVDARLLKKKVPGREFDLLIGLGPGFIPGVNCDCVVETMRGHRLGRVSWTAPAIADTGLPDGDPDRVLYAPISGTIEPKFEIADRVAAGDTVAFIHASDRSMPVQAKMSGILRGMLRNGVAARAGLKIGDIDARGDPSYCELVSDKALAIAGGVLEAILASPFHRSASFQ